MTQLIFILVAGILVGSTIANFLKWMNSEDDIGAGTVLVGVGLSSWYIGAVLTVWDKI